MRRLLFIPALLSALMAAAVPRVVWLNPEHDFGAFDEDLGVVTCNFRAVNVGDEPLVVTSARANCGCTTPHFTNDPVAPGDTLSILVGYNATGRPGRFSKKISVTTNGEPRRSTLTISGTVIGTSNTLRGRYPVDGGSVRLRDDKLPFGALTNISVATASLEGCNASHDTIRPRVENAPRYISVKVAPEAVAPGENFVVSAVFDGARCPDWDVVTDSLTLVCGSGRVTLHTAGIVREAFPSKRDKAPAISLAQRSVDFGRVDLGSLRKPMTARVEIFNTGDATLKLRKVKCSDGAVTVKVKSDTVKPGKSTFVTLTADPAVLAGRDMLNALLVIIANDPLAPRTTLRVTAELVNTK